MPVPDLTTCRTRRAALGTIVGLLAVGLGSCRVAGDGRSAATTATSAAIGHEQLVPLVGGGTLDLDAVSDQPLALWFWAPG